jgi:uncharacterized protein (DUF1697 family)
VTVMVALLRGVNVGGRNTLAMADLRKIAEECGLGEVRTYIQSGNLVCTSVETSTEIVGDELRRAIAAHTDVRPNVIVRTRDELAAVVQQNPFARKDPAHLHVVFIGGTDEASLGSVDAAAYAPEEAAVVGQHLYLYLPSGIGRSKLAADLARKSGPSGTTRNWRTVIKLLELADGSA